MLGGMAENASGGGRWVRLDDGEMHVVEDGTPGRPALLLLTNGAATTAIWDPVVPALAAAHHVVRINPLARGSHRYDVPTQARRVGTVLDRLGVSRVSVVGHSSGCMVATSLVEQRPDLVTALALVSMSPELSGQAPEPLAVRLLRTRFPGALLWRLRSEGTVRRAIADAFSRPVPVPEAMVGHMMAMAHRDLVGVLDAYTAYLGQRSLADRLAGSGRPLLVLFGTDDTRWRPATAAGYRAGPGARVELLPGVGHMPMMEDPETTGALLLEFAATAGRPS
jgi:pimeloyl-ACP methyl ester carboxylesterase